MKPFLSLCLLALLLCGQPGGAQHSPEQLESLFSRSEGWTGADGTYSIPTDDGSVLWCFSDTFFGRVEEGRRLKPFRFVNNSLVLQKPDGVTFLPAPAIMPPSGHGWFWIFDGIFRSNYELLLGHFEHHGEGAFGFRQIGLWYAKFQLPKLGSSVKILELKKIPAFDRRETELITFGPALLESPTWTYLYGIRQSGLSRQCIVGRTPRGMLGDSQAWRYYDGESWVKDMWKAAPLFDGASMEFSVHFTRSGECLYVGSAEGGISDKIVSRVAPQPFGPWEEPTVIAQAPEHGGTVFTYNAKAHPELSTDSRLLISYNVNTTDLEEVVEKADIYRPRFLYWTPPDPSLLPKPLGSGPK